MHLPPFKLEENQSSIATSRKIIDLSKVSIYLFENYCCHIHRSFSFQNYPSFILPALINLPCGISPEEAQIINLLINLQMSAKERQRIYSQQPQYASQNHHRKPTSREIMLIRNPSFQDEQLLPQRQTSHLAQKANINEKYGLQVKETQHHKRSMQDNTAKEKTRQPSNKLSEHKLRSAIYGINQIDSLFMSKGLDLTEAKADIKERRRKPKQRKKSVYFTKGNNHAILKEIFLTNFNFVEVQVRQAAHICWLQSSNQKQTGFRSSKSLYDDHLPQIGKGKAQPYSIIYNYLQCQSQLTNKERLYKNMKKYFPDSIGCYIPRSFIIDFKQEQGVVEENLFQFIKYYLKKQTKKPKSRVVSIKNYFMEINITNKQINRLLEKSQALLDGSFTEEQPADKQESDQIQDTLWILKPTSLNRGRGIHIFSNLKQLGKLLSESHFQISVKMYNDDMNPKCYIIQEYIQRPLLIDGFKFDMRVWVFAQVIKINGKKTLKVYLFKHGYSRLASVKYKFTNDDIVNSQKNGQNPQEEKNEERISPKKEKKAYINNRFIHLTNNAVQKESKQYGQFCQGNQLSIEQTVKYFQQKDPNCSLKFDVILESMKKMVYESFSSVKEKLVSANTSKTFQLLGYDFLIDQNYNIWLIEINCNPCLQESSQLLGKLLRQMLTGLVVLSDLQDPKSSASSEGWVEII